MTTAPVEGEVTVYVPRDSAARSVGADAVADRIGEVAAAQGRSVHIVRTGSRGMLWLEPLVEVATPGGRVAYGPVQPSDIDELIDNGLLEGADHQLSHGLTDEIEWLSTQQRLTFARVGVIDPLSVVGYQDHGGMVGLRRALSMSADDVVD